MKVKIITCLLLGIFFSNNSNAQRGGVTLPSIEASSLGIYGDVPVDLSKGTINVNIPIHTISVGNEDFPITLNYNASGIKIDQQASSTGLGWVMNNSALVTRVVRGLPDDVSTSPPVDLITNPDLRIHGDYYRNRRFTVYNNAGYFFSKTEVNSVMNISTTVLSQNGLITNYSDVALTPAQKQTMRKLSLGALDSEPDEFYFNLFGVSGKFIFDADKNIHLLSKSPMTIIPTITASGIEKFKIITPSGVTYHFELKETTQNHKMGFYNGYDYAGIGNNPGPLYKYTNYYWYCLGCVPMFASNSGSPNYNFDNPTTIFKGYDPRQKSPAYTSTWRVTKIEIPSVSDILFSYESRRILDFRHSKSTETSDWEGPGDSPENPNATNYTGIKKRGTVENYSVSASITDEKFLTKIDWHTGSISFNNLDRQDIPDINYYATYTLGNQNFAPTYHFFSEKSRLVSGIQINDMLKGNKSFDFSYSYFEADNCPTIGTVWEANWKRLKLDQVSLHDGSNYKLEYENQYKLPSLSSLKKDFWGYYNGHDNTDEIPTLYYYFNLQGNLQNSEHFSCFSIYPLQSQGTGITLNHAENMVPNINYAKTGTLKKITYPTKGYSEFEYELNTFILDGQERPGPGLRIKKVKHNDLVSTPVEKTYSYQKSDGLTSGNLPMLPIFTQLKYKPISYDGGSTEEPGTALRNRAIFYSTSNTMGMSHSVDYSVVTASTAANGKEEYIFDIPLKIGQKKHLNTSSGYVFDISYPKFKIHPEYCNFVMNGVVKSFSSHYSTLEVLDYFPFASAPNYSWNTGQLLQKNTYNAAGQKLNSIINTYGINAVEKNYYFKTGISYAHQYMPGSATVNAPENSIVDMTSLAPVTPVGGTYIEHSPFEEGTYDYYFTKPYYLFAFKSLIKTEEINYLDNGQISVIKENSYGNDLQVKSTTTTTSNNAQKNTVRYKHITDFANNTYLGTTAIGNPIEIVYEKTSSEDPANAVVTGGELFSYSNNLLSKHYKLNSDRKILRKLSDLNHTASGYYKNLSVDGTGNIVFDPSYELFSEFLRYDSFGNCLDFKTNYGAKSNSFLYGYNNKLLVASIENANYSQIEAAIDLNTLQTSTDSALKLQLDSLRAGLPNAMITTYNYYDKNSDGFSKYKLESITNPFGKSVFYNYYFSGKLRFIKDNNGKITEEFKYNFKN